MDVVQKEREREREIYIYTHKNFYRYRYRIYTKKGIGIDIDIHIHKSAPPSSDPVATPGCMEAAVCQSRQRGSVAWRQRDRGTV